MIVVLALVVGIVVGLGRLTRKWQGGRGTNRSVGRVDIISRRSVGRNVALLVVRAGNRTFLVSQGAQQMNLLSELDNDQWSTDLDGELLNQSVGSTPGPRTARVSNDSSPKAWDAFIEHLREMTVRR